MYKPTSPTKETNERDRLIESISMSRILSQVIDDEDGGARWCVVDLKLNSFRVQLRLTSREFRVQLKLTSRVFDLRICNASKKNISPKYRTISHLSIYIECESRSTSTSIDQK